MAQVPIYYYIVGLYKYSYLVASTSRLQVHRPTISDANEIKQDS